MALTIKRREHIWYTPDVVEGGGIGLIERPNQPLSFVVRSDQPLIGIILENEGHEFVEYTADDNADPAAHSRVLQDAIDVIGAWSDLDWDVMERALDRIRHQSIPTPPIEF